MDRHITDQCIITLPHAITHHYNLHQDTTPPITAIGDINTTIMTESTFTVSNINWEYFTSPKQTVNVVPNIDNAPKDISVPYDELDVHTLPDPDAYNYEAERDWMIQEYLLENYKMLAVRFDVALTPC
jgi:hypothetical protein